ncbi:hypothetical protein, partial [uncultured Intestinimonas sp.]|uniref:hypothetical protein n=1 Tax=uncultured Intestinimonas sp. TaxID=1689265 RepID=UPI0025DDF85B
MPRRLGGRTRRGKPSFAPFFNSLRLDGPAWAAQPVFFLRACLKIGDVSGSEGFWASGKQFFR